MDESVTRHLEQENETADVLRRARALIDAPEKHCPHAMVGANGSICSVLAVITAGNVYGHAGALLTVAAQELFNRTPTGVNYQGHEAVMQMFDRAIALAEQS